MSKTPNSAAGRSELLDVLDALKIAHETREHAPIFTVEEGRDIKAAMPGGHTKNLFLKDKDGQLFLICALGETKIPVNQLHKHFGCRRLSFAKPDLLLAHLGVVPGSVTVFSVMNDRAGAVTLALDQALFDHGIVNFHPLENTATTAISPDDMLRFCQHTKHDPVIIDFAAL